MSVIKDDEFFRRWEAINDALDAAQLTLEELLEAIEEDQWNGSPAGLNK